MERLFARQRPRRRAVAPARGQRPGNLAGGRFRFLNNLLYTCPSERAQALFAENPAAFEQYHAGYRQQMARWPVQPIAVLQRYILKNARAFRGATVVDLGCGEGELATRLAVDLPARRFRVVREVISLDLVALRPHVEVRDIAHTGLAAGSADCCVLSLSLMGTNYHQFIREALRLLRPGGVLLVVEIASRLQSPEGFARVVANFGATTLQQKQLGGYFWFFAFRRLGAAAPGANSGVNWGSLLRPCEYKRR